LTESVITLIPRHTITSEAHFFSARHRQDWKTVRYG